MSVEVHNLKLHAGADVTVMSALILILTGLAPDSQFTFIWGCWLLFIIILSTQTSFTLVVCPTLPFIHLGTAYFEGVHGAKFLNPSTGKLSFSTNLNMPVSEHFLPFKELVSNPGAVHDCFGLLGFRNLVAWTLVDKCVRKCFNGTWYIGTIVPYKLLPQCFTVQYCDGTEEYSPSELAVIYYSELLPSAFFLAFDLALAVVAAAHVELVCSPLTVLFGAVFVDLKLCSLLDQVAYSFDA